MPLLSRFDKMMIEQGRAEGAVEFGRNAIFDALAEICSAVPPVLIDRINAISDEVKLRLVLRAATHAKTYAEFELKLNNLN